MADIREGQAEEYRAAAHYERKRCAKLEEHNAQLRAEIERLTEAMQELATRAARAETQCAQLVEIIETTRV